MHGSRITRRSYHGTRRGSHECQFTDGTVHCPFRSLSFHAPTPFHVHEILVQHISVDAQDRTSQSLPKDLLPWELDWYPLVRFRFTSTPSPDPSPTP